MNEPHAFGCGAFRLFAHRPGEPRGSVSVGSRGDQATRRRARTEGLARARERGFHLTLTCPRASWVFLKRIYGGQKKGPPDFSKWAFHTGGASSSLLSCEIRVVSIRRIPNSPSRSDGVPRLMLLDRPRFAKDTDRASQLFSFILSPLPNRLFP